MGNSTQAQSPAVRGLVLQHAPKQNAQHLPFLATGGNHETNMPSLNNWKIFFSDHATPADAQAIAAYPEGPLTLANGEVVQPMQIQLRHGVVGLETMRPGMPECPNEGYAIAVASLRSEQAQTVNLGLATDWWLEAYVNGILVGSTRETGHGSPDYTPLAHVFPVQLCAGENTVSVWLHHGPWTMAWPFCAAILPPPPEELPSEASLAQYRMLFHPTHERIISGPFLKSSGSGLQVQVELFQSLAAILQVRRQGAERWTEIHETVLGKIPVDNHHVFQLPTLAPQTAYEYRLKTADTSLENAEISPTYTFRTPASENSVHRLFCTSDLQMQASERTEILQGFLDHDEPSADLFCTLGDLVNSTENLFHDYFITALNPVLDCTEHRQVWVPVRGNHEFRGSCSTDWLRLFGCSYYLFRYADTAYLVLDSGDDKRLTPAPHVYTRRNDHVALFNAQREWLLQALATPEFQTARHRIVLCHATPFDQDADFEEFHEQFMARNLQRLVGDFFYGSNPLYSIDLWISGHTHKSARYTPKDQRIASFYPPGNRHLSEREKGLYPFPVVVLDGPGNLGPQASGMLVTVAPECIEVLSRQASGELIDHIRILPDHSVEVLETALQ